MALFNFDNTNTFTKAAFMDPELDDRIGVFREPKNSTNVTITPEMVCDFESLMLFMIISFNNLQ